MVLLSLSDALGVVDMTVEAIAGRTGWSVELLRRGIAELEAADPRSRTADAEGRRIIRLDQRRDWGWRITNYLAYRDRERARERRDYLRQKKRESRARQGFGSVNNSQQGQQSQPIAEATADADANAKAEAEAEAGKRVAPVQEIVDLYHELCPTLPRVKVLTDERRQEVQSRWDESQERRSLSWWKRYFAFVDKKCRFLLGKNQRKWCADFDFLMRADKLVKVTENNYVDRADR
jgi:hypothetical protein